MPVSSCYRFGSWSFDAADGALRGSESCARLPPKVSDTLRYLLDHANCLIRKEELMDAVWPGLAVEEIGLARNICAIRKALGSGRGTVIETIPKRGYRLLATVRKVEDSAGDWEATAVLQGSESLRACAQALASFYFDGASGFKMSAR